MLELLTAKTYYGMWALGWVVLCNGQPYHFIGVRAFQEAKAFMKEKSK